MVSDTENEFNKTEIVKCIRFFPIYIKPQFESYFQTIKSKTVYDFPSDNQNCSLWP